MVFNNIDDPIFSSNAIIIAIFGENVVSPEIYITTHIKIQFENIKSARNIIIIYIHYKKQYVYGEKLTRNTCKYQ